MIDNLRLRSVYFAILLSIVFVGSSIACNPLANSYSPATSAGGKGGSGDSISGGNVGEGEDHDNMSQDILMHDYSSFVNSGGNVVVVGSVMVTEKMINPVEVQLGLDVYNKVTDKNETIQQYPVNKVLYKGDHPTPFKFVIDSSKYSYNYHSSAPYVYDAKNVTTPSLIRLQTFDLKYTNGPQGPLNQLVGNVTNTSPHPIYNLTLYAVVHDKNGTQVDSVTTPIPAIKPKETLNFEFTPDSSIKDKVYSFSCVAGDINNMKVDSFKIININSNKTLGYKFSGMMEVDKIDYNNDTNKLQLKVNNFYPIPASLSVQLMPGQKEPLSIIMDNSGFSTASVVNDEGKTTVDLNIPMGRHDLTIAGIKPN
ncbi:MAG: FxLYD domain-containing protein [Thermoproteota archaeon]|nr:FxLYD domain-containing protein [Thermoproteota archaeon]